LDDLERVLFVAHEADRNGERATAMAFHELAERAAVTSLSTQDELTISLRFSRTTYRVGRLGAPRIQLGRNAASGLAPARVRPNQGKLGGAWGPAQGSGGLLGHRNGGTGPRVQISPAGHGLERP
jgi:hypothetical protein